MPKMKTNSGAKKRFQVTGKGKLLRKKASNRHNLSAKSNACKRNLGGKVAVSVSDESRVAHLLGMK